MPCLRRYPNGTRCANTPSPTFASIGAGEGYCVGCYTQLVNEITGNWPNLGKSWAEDYALIEVLFTDRATTMQYLRGLNAEMEARVAQLHASRGWQKRASAALYRKLKDDKPYVRLSVVLEHFEALCWFPTVHVLPLGLLSVDDFYYYISHGLVLKDYGAGVKHGEFTHRLQWYILGRAITNNFTTAFRAGWSHSPFELYTHLGSAGARNGREGGNTGGDLWGRLFDRGGLGNGYFEPDTFHGDVMKGAGLAVLRHSLSRRLRKRREELLAAEQEVVPGILADLNTYGGNGDQRSYWKRDLRKSPFERVPKRGGFGERDADLDQNLAGLPSVFGMLNRYSDVDVPAMTAPKLIEQRAGAKQVEHYVARKQQQGKWTAPAALPAPQRYPGGAWKVGDERPPTDDEVRQLRAKSRSGLQHSA